MNAPTDNSTLETDRERVTCLLLINSFLIKKALHIYQTVLSNQQSLQQIPQQTRHGILESYQNYTRRVHCNLSVLSYIHEKYHGSDGQSSGPNKTTFPIIMSAPQDMPELNQLYGKLQGLYPDALQFLRSKIQQMRKQPHFQQANSNSPVTRHAPHNSQQMSPMTPNPSLGGTSMQNQHNPVSQNAMSPGNYLQQNIASGFNSGSAGPILDNSDQERTSMQAKQQMQTMSPQQILSRVNSGGDDPNGMSQSLNPNINSNHGNSSKSGMIGFF